MEPLMSVLLINHNHEVLGGLFHVITPARIYHLKKLVKEERQNDLVYVDAARLTVWRCTDRTTTFNVALEVLNHRVRDLFFKHEVEQLFGNPTIAQLNILEEETLLVKVPGVRPPSVIPTERQPTEDEFFERLKSLKLANAQPSKFNDYKVYSELQKNEKERIFNNRPKQDVDIPPLPLLYRGFGLFSDSIKSGIASSSVKGGVDKLVEAVCEIGSEEEKQSTTQDLLHKILFPGGAPFINDSSKRATEGHILTAANGGPLFIVEYKREIDVAEPQLAAHFIQLVVSAKAAVSQIYRGWRQPALGLTIRGEYISFFGFVMVDAQVRMLPLTPTFPCNMCGSDSNAPLYVAFSAAKDLLKNIEEDAKDFVPAPENPGPIPHRFPYIQSLHRFCSDSQQEHRINFRITESLGDGVQDRFLYVADVVNTESKPILVKFSQKYSKELHEFCALRDFAPQLLAFEEFPGGWFGIAMECFPLAVHINDSPSLIKQGETWLKQMDEIVETLHEHGYVHGDLRVPNFLVDEERLLLIDFDWGGKEGQATFPDADLLPMLRASRDVELIGKENDRNVIAFTKTAIRQQMWKLLGAR